MKRWVNIAWIVFLACALPTFIASSGMLIYLLLAFNNSKPISLSRDFFPVVAVAWFLLMAGMTLLSLQRRSEKPSSYLDISR